MTFSGLNLAMRGLFASQHALNITSQNVMNTSNKGYVRRTAEFTSISTAGIKGVSVAPVRMRDRFLDSKVWNQNSVSNEWSTKNEYYEKIMNVLDEPTEYSINVVKNEFFKAFEDLAKDPSNLSYRTAINQKAYQFTDVLNTMASQLENLQYDLNEQVKVQTEAINVLASEIADLNALIYKTEIAGGDASYSRDTFENKIKELSQYANVEVIEENRGTLINGAKDMRVTVMFGGVVLVDHDHARQLVCEKRIEKKNPEDIDGLYRVVTKEGSALDLNTGSLKATIELRDGTGDSNGTWVKGVVYYERELNKFARTFAKAFNEGIIDYNGDGVITEDEKKNGYADAYVYGDPEATAPAGIRFFTPDGISTEDFINGETDLDAINALYDQVTAKNIKMSVELENNTDNIISSFIDPSYRTDTNSVLELISFRGDTNIFGTGDIDSFVESMVTSIGLDAKTSQALNNSHQSLLEQAENNRSAYSDVSIDEEATFLVMYQQMYKACAKSIRTFQEIYQSLLAAV